jgi:hypothetical protein
MYRKYLFIIISLQKNGNRSIVVKTWCTYSCWGWRQAPAVLMVCCWREPTTGHPPCSSVWFRYTVDNLQLLGAEAGPCRTDGLLLEGAHHWTPTMFIRLVQVCSR